MYAILGAQEAEKRKLPIGGILRAHPASYHCGAYLGCDIQTMPEAICVDTGREIGYGTAPLKQSPITGGKVWPWVLQHGGRSYRPREIHHLFYGRTHVVFGWQRKDREHTVPWEHLGGYCADAVRDALLIHKANDRSLAYLFGWMAHIVGDSLIKSVQPGVDLHLHGGKYTPANRPIQDLVTFHEVGRKELKLDWLAILDGLAKTPVEDVQFHYMRVANRRGELGDSFGNAWAPEHTGLLGRVLHENRRYQAIRNPRLLKQLELHKTKNGWDCDPALNKQSLGLHYLEMVELAKKANFRHALWQIGSAIADLFVDVVERVPELQR